MLAGALFYVALLVLVGTTILSAGLAMTRMTVTRMARPYLATGYQRAASSLQRSVAAQMQSGGSPYPAPAFTPIPAACANAACTYMTTERITLSSAPPSVASSCDPEETNCAANVQTNGYVREGRMSALVTVTVQDANGAKVATQDSTVILRTMSTPPYAAIAGARDAAFDDVVNAHAPGDDGGAAPATPNPCTSAIPGAADDTAVRVAYRNQATNACTDGSSWASSSYSAPSSTAGWGSE